MVVVVARLLLRLLVLVLYTVALAVLGLLWAGQRSVLGVPFLLLTVCFVAVIVWELHRATLPAVLIHNPKGPCTQIVYTLAAKYLCRDYFKAKVYTIWGQVAGAFRRIFFVKRAFGS